MDLVIRPMTLADVPLVRAIDVLSFPMPWSERSYHFELTENQASRLWVAEQTSASGELILVGMLVIWLILDEAHIGTIATHPDHRGHRIAHKLLATGLLAAAHEGAKKSFLEVRRGNMAAQSVYQRFGYQVVGVRARYYHDNGEDALLMNLEELSVTHLQALLDQTGEQSGFSK